MKCVNRRIFLVTLVLVQNYQLTLCRQGNRKCVQPNLILVHSVAIGNKIVCASIKQTFIKSEPI